MDKSCLDLGSSRRPLLGLCLVRFRASAKTVPGSDASRRFAKALLRR
jgi:hypothetical protein